MLKSIVLLVFLFSTISAKAQLEIELDLSSFDVFNNGLYWPVGPDNGEPQVSVESLPNDPQIAGSTIRVELNSFNGGTYVSVSDWSDDYMRVWFSVSIPKIFDQFGKDLNAGAFLMCNTSDGQSGMLFNGGTWDREVAASSTRGAEINCFMGEAYRANITITKILIEPKIQAPKELPIVKCDFKVNSHSYIATNTSALVEDIPLTGVPFDLGYSSHWTKAYGKDLIASLGLGGWAPTNLKRYADDAHILVHGSGDQQTIEPTKIEDGVYSIVGDGGSETYIFNDESQHVRTIDNILGQTIFSFEYQPDGKIAAITNKFGQMTTFNYSGQNVTITSPYGQVTTLIIDGQGYLISVKNPNNEIYTLTNDQAGTLLAFQKPMGQQSHVTYDAEGRAIADTGAGGDSVTITRNFDESDSSQVLTTSSTMGRVTQYKTKATESTSSKRQVVHPFGGVDNYSNSDIGLNESTDLYGNEVQYTTSKDPRFGDHAPYTSHYSKRVPNSNIHIETSTSKAATSTNSTYPFTLASATETIIQQNDPTRTSTTTYNGATKTYMNVSPMNRVTYAVLNNQGLVGATQIGGLQPVNYAYDNSGRLVNISQGSRVSKKAWDNRGNLATSTDELGRITTYFYDGANRLNRMVSPDGGSVYFSYDANGNLISLTPAQRYASLFTYNLMELPSSDSAPVIGNQNSTTTYEYNLDKQLTRMTKPEGTQINLNYGQSTGLLDSISTSTGNYIYSYFPNTDLIKTMQSPSGINLDYTYAGNVQLSESVSGPFSSSISYGYNTDGTLQSLKILNAPKVVNYSYDKDLLLKGVLDQSMTLNNFGAIDTTKVGKVTQKLNYNNFGEITRDLFTNESGAVLSDRTYTRDNLGRVTSVAGLSFNYDVNGRLISAFRGSVLVRKYIYDQNGAWTKVFRNGVTTVATTDAQDRLTQFGSLNFEYNANGERTKKIEHSGHSHLFGKGCNLHHKDKVTSYNYDAIGNLKTVKLPSGYLIEYIYDGRNRRVGKKINGVLTQAFVYQSQTQIAAELNGAGQVVRQFVYGTKSNSPDLMIYKGREYKIISDQVGTPLLIIDTATGKTITKYVHDEFGNFLAEFNMTGIIPIPIFGWVSHARVEVPFGFAGGLFDRDTELVHFGARDYDPVVGRWITKDPIGFAGGDTNLYGYVLNDPVNFIDPSGLTQAEVDEARAWIAKNRPDLLKGVLRVFTLDSSIPGLTGNVGLAFPYTALIDTDSIGESCEGEIRQAAITSTLAHELMHLQDGFINTIRNKGRSHEAIREAAYQVGLQYLNSIRKKKGSGLK